MWCSWDSGDGLLQSVLQAQVRDGVDQQESEAEAAAEGTETPLPPRHEGEVLRSTGKHHPDDHKVYTCICVRVLNHLYSLVFCTCG